MSCIDKLLNQSKELHDYLRERAGKDYDPKTGEGKQEWIKAAKELQDHSVKTLNDVYAEVKVPGYEKTKVPITTTQESVTDKGISKVGEVTSEEKNRLIETIPNKMAKGGVKDLSVSDFNDFVKNEVAQQANASESEQKTARNFYGDELVDYAKKLYPESKTEINPEGELAKKETAVPIVSDKKDLPKELIGETKVSNTGFGGEREHTSGKVNLEDLKVLDNGIETAKNTLKSDHKFKASKEPIVVGVDVNTGEKQLLDGYHRYISKDGKGEVDAKFIPMKDGNIISFDEAKSEPITNKEVQPTEEELRKGENPSSKLDAEKRFEAGEKLYGFSEMDETLGEPTLITSVKQLDLYDPDKIISFKPKENKEVQPSIENKPEIKVGDTFGKNNEWKVSEDLGDKVKAINEQSGVQTIFDKNKITINGRPTDTTQPVPDAGTPVQIPNTPKEGQGKEVSKFKPVENTTQVNKQEKVNEPPTPTNNVNEVIGNTDNTTGITHEQTNEIADQLGFGHYEAKPETVDDWDAEAEKRIKDDPQTIPKLLGKMEKGGQPDKVEQRIMAKYVATLQAEIEKDPSNEKIAHLRNVIDLSNIAGGREVAKSLVARKGQFPINDSLAGYFMTEMDANLDAPLTDGQKETVKKEYNDISAKDKVYKENIAKLEAENARLKAEVELNKTKKKTTTPIKQPFEKTHEDYVKERQSLKDKLKQQVQDYKAAGQKLGIAADGGAESFIITAKMAKTIGEIVKSHVEEVGNKLAEVTKRTFEDVKDFFEGISEKDIHDVIAGEYNEKKKTKSEVAKNLFDLKTQAQLINKLQRLIEGTEPKNEKDKIKRNQEIESLQKQITDFKKENPDREAQLKTLKTKNDNELKKVQQELDTGNFAEPIKNTPLLYDSELKNKHPKLYNDALNSQNALIKAKQERQIRLMLKQYESRSDYQKLKDKAIRLLNVPRTLMASMDYSAPLRQAVTVTVAHPIMAAKAASVMFKSSFSQKYFDRWSYDLKETSRYQTMIDSKLSLTDPHSLHLQAQEEAFMGNIAEQIPIAGALVKGSERAYVAYLNKMRVDLFNRYADVFEENGRTFENSKELYKGLASYINNATGRGNLGFAETAAPILNSFLFSPRLIASRINMLGLGDIATLGNGFYGKLPKEIRILAMKDMAKFIGAGVGVLALANYGFGLQTEDDPRSSDFGKIKSGDTRWDIWGGFQPYVRVLAQVIMAQRKSTNTGKVIPLEGKGSKFGTNRADPLVSFSRGKLAPIPSMTWDILSKRTVIGNKVLFQWGGKHKENEITLKDEAIQHFLPLIYSDVSQAMQDKGVSSLFTVGIPSTFGVGVQTYSNPKSKK